MSVVINTEDLPESDHTQLKDDNSIDTIAEIHYGPHRMEQNTSGQEMNPDASSTEIEEEVIPEARPEPESLTENAPDHAVEGPRPNVAGETHIIPETVPENTSNDGTDCEGGCSNVGIAQEPSIRGGNESEETVVKRVQEMDLGEQRPDLLNPPPVVEDHRPGDECPARDENGEMGEVGVIHEGPEKRGQAVPIPNDEVANQIPDLGHNLQDKTESIIEMFANVDEFFKFSTSSNGLRMNDDDIKKIQSNDRDPHDQKVDTMRKWMKDNAGVTCEKLDEIVDHYFETKRQPSAIRQDPNQAPVANAGPQQAELRMEDVFDSVSKSFASITDFKKFARSSNGLGLTSDDVNHIETDFRRKSMRQKHEMLRLWRQNAQDPTPQRLLDIRENYRTQRR